MLVFAPRLFVPDLAQKSTESFSHMLQQSTTLPRPLSTSELDNAFFDAMYKKDEVEASGLEYADFINPKKKDIIVAEL